MNKNLPNWVWCFMLFFVACTLNSFGQCKAIAEHQKDSQNPLKYYFINHSQEYNSFEWRIGNLHTDTIRSNTDFTFEKEGTYNYQLFVFGANNCADSISGQIVISIENGNCITNFSHSYEEGSPNRVIFTDLSSTNTDPIVNWNWDFGDGTTSFEKDPSKDFGPPGTYNVCLSITTEAGCTDSYCSDVHISNQSGGENCSAYFQYNVDSADGLEVHFEDQSSAESEVQYWNWNFGDGTESVQQNPIKQYDHSETYPVCLTITSHNGCEAQFCDSISVSGESSGQNCQAAFEFYNNSPDGSTYSFTDYSSAGSDDAIISLSFTAGDGSTYTDNSFEHQYSNDGIKTVCLTIETEGGCEDSYCQTVDVVIENSNGGEDDHGQHGEPLVPIHGCLATIWAEKDSSNSRKFTFKSRSASADGQYLSNTWEIKGEPYYGPEVGVEFQNDGEHHVSLYVHGEGCADTAKLTVFAGQEGTCNVSFTHVVDPMNPSRVQFALSGTTNLNEGFWQFGDGLQSDKKNPIHHFEKVGYKNVCVTAYDPSSGCQTSKCAPIFIQGDEGSSEENNCYANFDYHIDGNSVSFTNTSQGNYTVLKYIFGDGKESEEYDPTHPYDVSGVYDVCIRVANPETGCVSELCKSVTILANPEDVICHADFDFFPVGEKKFVFANHSHGNFSEVKWEFLDGLETKIGNEVEFEFPGSGHYEVCLSVFDSASQCFNSRCKVVEIVDSNVVNCRADFDFFLKENREVVFSSRATGAFTNIHFSLGDGKINDKETFSYQYASPGHYEVCMAIFDSISGCQDQFCQKVVVFPDDTNVVYCEAKMDGYLGDDGVAYVTNLSIGDYTDVLWNFGDGYQTKENAPSHIFERSGIYNICLSIFDEGSGCHSKTCDEVNIQLDSNDINCSAEFNYVTIGDEVKVENTSIGQYTNSHWSFGDGRYADGNQSNHIFDGTGVYEICLDIWDSISGCQASVCKLITIQKDTQDVFCGARFDFIQLENGGFEFFGKPVGNFTDIYWDLGNGDFSNTMSFGYAFKNPGHYDVCMSIKDEQSGCHDQICMPVAVAPNGDSAIYCQAKMDGFIDDNGIAHTINQSIGEYTHAHWDFGDGNQSYENEPTHEFAESGYYYICLSIHDTVSGCQSSICEEVNIQLDSGDVNCLADFEYIVIDGVVTLKNTSIGDNSHAHWSFGDGDYADGSSATHEYSETGVYEVCLHTWDSISGCQATICKPITIQKDTQDIFCEAKFEYIPLANGELQFKDASKGSYTHIHWDLGNGMFADHNDPIGSYSSKGVYTVSLMIRDSVTGCQDSYREEVAIGEDKDEVECHAKFEFFPINDSLVKFKSSSKGQYTDIKWEFGDGTFSEGDRELEHEFPHGGFFNVCMGIYDANSGCHDYNCEVIELLRDTNVVDCKAEFEFFPLNGSTVAFNNLSAGTFTKSFWKFDNGSVNYNENPTVDFASGGLYKACLTVFDELSGCQDEFCVEVPIIDDNTDYCDAHFEYYTDGRTVKFEPQIKGDITGWIWDYNDGFNSNDSFPSHTYQNDGVYEVCLTVFDSISGCFNTYCDQISVIGNVDQIDEYVKADFSYFLDPVDGKVHFKDESTGNPSKWYWDFGDGDSAGVSKDPIYDYVEDGYYEVCLTVRNNTGGQETKCEVISVGDVSNACHAKFDYYANAVTATAHFDNKSLGNITGYNWDFGDKVTSFQFNPSHTYADTGFYPVCLTVSNDVGCERTFCKEIRVGNSLEQKCLIGCVWPGDANLDTEANHYDILPIGLHYGETGPERSEESSEWRGHESQDWSSLLWGDVNNKHGDANGDGVIDIDDIGVIEQNFAYSHPWQPRANAANQLSIDWDVDDIDIGATAVLTVSIPDSLDVTMYGIGFEIDLDPEIFDYNSINYDFSNSFLGTEDEDLITFGTENENLGQIYISESRNDHQELTGNGELVRINVTAIGESDAVGAVLTTEGGVTAEGDTVEFDGAEDGTIVKAIEDREGYFVRDLVVYPNPTTGIVSYNLPIGLSTDYVIEIYDNVGAIVHSITQTGGGRIDQNLEEFESGIYTIQVKNDKVKYLQKIIVSK
ncbi:MAG: hypothetical protein CMP61_04950 [Flavobacteriales bacterium]|nr:hypothetical protein [Flavobacteriales bacterium]